MEIWLVVIDIQLHDELINSHHWHTDSLKLSNVQEMRDISSMLYNTPAMVHISRDEASSVKTQRIRALQHYQQGFEPIHKALWNKKLNYHKWLSADGYIQQTVFENGSSIIANFDSEPRSVRVDMQTKTLKPYSIEATLKPKLRKDTEIITWQSVMQK